MKVYRKLIRPVHCYPGQGYEPKTELVEKEEKWYPEEEREHLEEKYGYLNEGHFSDLIFEEKYEPYLLKEQEAHELTKTEWEQWKKDKNREPICMVWYGDTTPIWVLKPESISEPLYLMGKIKLFDKKPRKEQVKWNES
jgi:hypothetical protein